MALCADTFRSRTPGLYTIRGLLNSPVQLKAPFRVVIAATDGSDLGGIAIQGARLLAGRTDAELHVIHVPDGVAAPEAASDQVADLLDGVPHRYEIRSLVETGHRSASQVIDQYADEVGDAIVVVGSRARVGLSSALLGSTASELVSRPQRSTVIYGPKSNSPVAVAEVIACADSTFGNSSIEEGSRWASALQVPLRIVQVLPFTPSPSLMMPESTYAEARAKELSGLPLRVEWQLLHSNSPTLALSEAFGSYARALLVMATYGRAGSERAMFGGVSSETVRRATGPIVLTHPSPARHPQTTRTA